MLFISINYKGYENSKPKNESYGKVWEQDSNQYRTQIMEFWMTSFSYLDLIGSTVPTLQK